MLDELKRAALRQLGDRPTPAQRRQVIARLRELADEQEQLLRAIEADLRQPPEARKSVKRKRGAGPGRAPSEFVRIERRVLRGTHRTSLYIGRALFYQLGSPRRIDIQRLGGQLVILVAQGDAGWSLQSKPGTMPRAWVDGAADLLMDLEDGRYAGEVIGGRKLIIKERL